MGGGGAKGRCDGEEVRRGGVEGVWRACGGGEGACGGRADPNPNPNPNPDLSCQLDEARGVLGEALTGEVLAADLVRVRVRVRGRGRGRGRVPGEVLAADLGVGRGAEAAERRLVRVGVRVRVGVGVGVRVRVRSSRAPP